MSSSSMTRAERRQARRIKRFDNPWMNPKLIWGAGLLLAIIAIGIIGRLLWNLDLVFTGSATLKYRPGVERCPFMRMPVSGQSMTLPAWCSDTTPVM